MSMTPGPVLRAAAVAMFAGIAACGPTPAVPSVTIGAATAATPANGAQISFYSQPVRLVVQNGAVASGSPAITIEVATDSAFANKVLSQVAQQSTGAQTTLTLGSLSAATDYYWHVKTTAGDAASPFSATSMFSIGPAVILQPPAPATPADASVQRNQLTLAVKNAVTSGPAGTLTYQFQVATDPAFNTLVASGTTAEGLGSTSFAVGSPLPSYRQFYWRVRVSESAHNLTSQYSAVRTFATTIADDATYAATFEIDLPPSCRPLGLSHLIWNGSLSIDGPNLQLTPRAPQGGFLEPTSTFITLVQSNTQVSGVAAGRVGAYDPASPWWFYGTDAMGGNAGGTWALTGAPAGDGVLAGSFAGVFHVADRLGGQYAVMCPSQGGFNWKITFKK